MKPCQTLLSADVIVTQNPAREIIWNGAIAIGQGKILDIGAEDKLRSLWLPRDDLNLGSMLILPGLINSHSHAPMTFLRGLADDLPLMTWLEQSVFPVEARLTREIVRLGALLGHAEMLATGTTACLDMYLFEDAVFEAATQSGIRCMGGEAVFGFPSAASPSWRHALDSTRALAEKYAGNERLAVAVNPHSVYTTTPEILAACRDLALEMDLPLHIHLAETRDETERCLEAYGARPVAHCVANDLFDARVIAAHLVDLTPAEARLLAQKGACGVHNPSSNMKLASGMAPVRQTLAQGLPLGLGTDGPASNNAINIFTEMGRAALLGKLADNDPSALPAATILDMATLGGAAVLGNSGIGSLEPGKCADLIALDLTRPNMQPLHNPVSQAVYAASGHECRLTMVAGEILYRDGAFTRFDYDALCREAGQLRDFAAQK